MNQNRVIATSRRAAAMVLFLATAGIAVPASAAVGDWVEGSKARVRLIASGVDASGRLEAGIEIELAPGWHTYWRSPGDAGVAPVADFSGSRNIGPAELAFPPPRRLDDGYSVTNVYEDRVVLPVAPKVANPANPVDLVLKLDIGVCAEVCVPEHFEASLNIPASEADATTAELLSLAEKALPGQAVPGTFAVEKAARAGGTEKRPVFEITAAIPNPREAQVFVEGPSDWYGDAPKLVSGGGHGPAVYQVTFDRLTAKTPIAGAELRVTIVSGSRAIEQTIALDAPG